MRDTLRCSTDQGSMWPQSGSTNPMGSGKSWYDNGRKLSCPTKEVAFADWHDEFDPESGFPRSAPPGMADA
jgi:hypothetical protein